MIAKEIISLQHPLIKHCVLLRRETAYRYHHQEVLVTGKQLITELASCINIKILFVQKELYAEQKIALPPFPGKTILSVPFAVLKKITALEHPDPFAAIVSLPERHFPQSPSYLLALDGIADPGNLGTLLRSALAFGWEGVFLTKECCDPFNDKALRSAKGATFRLPLLQGDPTELCALIALHKMQAYVADNQGVPYTLRTLKTSKIMLILGNEAHGVSSFFKTKYPLLSIPIHKEMESLNVACAGAILMHALKEYHL